MTASARVTLLDEWYEQLGSARPILRWAGGKQNFLVRFGRSLPPVQGRYFEPFVGGAAVFLYVQRASGRPLEAILGDVNVPLIRTYNSVRQEPEAVYQQLHGLQEQYLDTADRSKFYYEIREQFNAALPAPDPAHFIFLNRTCWNGLYRVNRRGFFNVPYGRPRGDIVIPTLNELVNLSAALLRARLRATSWENTVAQARKGDFVFLDPPYFSDIARDDVKYKARQFDITHHHRLASRLEDFASRGIDFVLTNSGEEEMVQLYESHGLSVFRIKAPRAISSRTDQRLPVEEIVVTPPFDGTTPFRATGAVFSGFLTL